MAAVLNSRHGIILSSAITITITITTIGADVFDFDDFCSLIIFYSPFNFPPQFDFIRLINSLFRVGERYAGFRRGYNGLVTDLGARGFFDHEPVLAARALEREDLEVRDSGAIPNDDVNFWTEFVQKETLNPKLEVRGFSDDIKARDSGGVTDADVNFWTEFAQKEALNPQLSLRGFHDDEDLESRDLEDELY